MIVPTLRGEEKRRVLTLLAMSGALVVSTLPITNERALFSPFADPAAMADMAPLAYAMIVGSGAPAGRGGTGGGAVSNVASETPPVAFGAIVPPGAPVAAQNAPLGPAGSVPTSAGNGLGGGPSLPAGAPGGGGGGGGGGTPPGGGGPTPVSPVPEPDTWATMIVGFGIVGWLLRRRRADVPVPALA